MGNVLNTTVTCDICSRKLQLTPKAKYDLERAGWSVFCSKCAEKQNIDKWKAKKMEIKIYKI